MSVTTVRVHTLDNKAKIPSYAHPGDAGVDLSSTVDITLKPFQRAVVPCGIAIAIDDGYAGLVIPRSGLAAKHGISVVNGPGLIDSGYRGEIKVILINLDPENDFQIHVGDRIAQLMVVEAPKVIFEEVDSLDITQRAENGFGSSGV